MVQLEDNSAKGVYVSLVVVAVATSLLLTALPSVKAHETATLQFANQVQVASYNLNRGEKVDYSWEANGLLLFSIMAHLEMPGHNQNDDIELLLLNTSGEGTFEAPYTPPDVGAWIYNFSFTNMGFQEVNVTYDISKVRSSGPIIFLIAFAIVVVLGMIFTAILLRSSTR